MLILMNSSTIDTTHPKTLDQSVRQKLVNVDQILRKPIQHVTNKVSVKKWHNRIDYGHRHDFVHLDRGSFAKVEQHISPDQYQ